MSEPFLIEVNIGLQVWGAGCWEDRAKKELLVLSWGKTKSLYQWAGSDHRSDIVMFWPNSQCCEEIATLYILKLCFRNYSQNKIRNTIITDSYIIWNFFSWPAFQINMPKSWGSKLHLNKALWTFRNVLGIRFNKIFWAAYLSEFN